MYLLCFILVAIIFELTKDHPNENTRRLLIQKLPQQGSQLPSLVFLGASKAGEQCNALEERKDSGMLSDLRLSPLGKLEAG